jgi:predicted AlkP superfamily pyrophosphatase or phosphodiesterase
MSVIIRLLRPLLGLVMLLATYSVWAEPPRLVVVIAVDQMRADYLDRFAANYEGGLRRLRVDGAVFTDGHQGHALTQTAAGHATIATGVYPSRHGLVANEFWDRTSQQAVGAVADSTTALVGVDGRAGSSPSRLLRSGLGDWLKMQSPGSKVTAVSIKDRAAILLSGMSPDVAFWADLRTGQFVTSDYYLPALPVWAAEFNSAGAVTRYNGTEWTKLKADAVYDESPWPELAGRDPASYSMFPHLLGTSGEAPDRRFLAAHRSSPYADLVTLNFARELFEHEDFGRDEVPDLLFIGLSAADYIGHRYGPYSHEIHDHFLRLDGYLGDFFEFLDEQVGLDDYVVALSADHGALPVPEQLAELGVDASRIHPDELVAFVIPVVEAALARGDIAAMPEIDYQAGPALRFSGEQPSPAVLDALQLAVAARLLQHPLVAATYTYNDQLRGNIEDDDWANSFGRSFHPDRAPDVTIKLRENQLLRPAATGTGHGSPYRYDTHVPIVFLGARIASGHHSGRVQTTDIAPTLARILEIEAPDDLDGRDLYESIRPPMQ